MSLAALAREHNAEKGGVQHYLRTYEELIGPMVDRELKLLELGVMKGGSLLMWRDYLTRTTVVGLDINEVDIDDKTGRIRFYQGEQQNRTLLDRIAAENAPNGFDIIIDDASHIGQYTRISFWHLFEHHLKPGGFYFIEDWGCSYWNVFPDGKHYRPRARDFSAREKALNWLHSLRIVQTHPLLRRVVHGVRGRLVQRSFPSHMRGMVGFVKELVDECGMPDITHGAYGLPPRQPSLIKHMRISTGHILIIKAVAGDADAPRSDK